MQRRDVLRLLGSAAVASSLPLETFAALREARAEVADTGGLRRLNAHANATVTTMCDLIIPETSTPGAKATKVNEFIDLMLTEWYDKPDTDRFLQGLADVDVTSKKQFGKDFIQCSPAQQHALMTDLDNGAMEYARTAKVAKAANAAKSMPPPTNFFYTLKRLTLVGYYTSEVGFSKELGKSIIPMKHAGCAPLAEARS